MVSISTASLKMNGLCNLGRVMAKAVSSWYLTTEFQVRSHVSLCEICGR